MAYQASAVVTSTPGLEGLPRVISVARIKNTHRGRNYDLHARNIGRVIQTMLQRLDVPMSNDEMADIACLSPCHFNRVFHQLTGIPPIRFHYALRLQRAKHLLISTDLSITNICFEIGYNSLGTFVSRFNELVGLPPSAYRRFTRQFAAMDLRELRAVLMRHSEPSIRRQNCVTGAIEYPEGFDGVIFFGLFRRGIPEGQPVSCALTIAKTTFSIPVPSPGEWFVFAVAAPWIVDTRQLFTLDGLLRGRSGLIRHTHGESSGDSAVALRSPDLLDPPILATIPHLLSRFNNGFAAAKPDTRPDTGLERPALQRERREGLRTVLSASGD
jgi:AraC family transcriptional regulator